MRRLSILSSLLCCLGLLLWAFWLEPDSLTNDHIDLSLSNWPVACNGLRIVLLADLHVSVLRLYGKP